MSNKVEPTEAMLNAARDWSDKKYGKPIGNDAAIGCWNAMYAAFEASLARPQGGGEEAMGEALFALSDRLRADGFLDRKDHHEVYERVVAAWQQMSPIRTPPADEPEMGDYGPVEQARDEGADYVLGELASMLGLTEWEQKDGSETWDGDVSATLYGILEDARVLDPEDNSIARHATPPADDPFGKDSPANRDCLAKARLGEPMFIILGRDPDGATIVKLWADRRAAAGDPDHAAGVFALADAMREYAADPKNAPESAPDASAYPPADDRGDALRDAAREAFYNLIADARRWDEQFDGDADDHGRPIVSVYYYLELDGHSQLEELCDALGVPPGKWEESLKDRIDRAIDESSPPTRAALATREGE